MRWKVPANSRLVISEWDENSVVFNSLSGQTHQLNPIALESLRLLQQDVLTSKALSGLICDLFGLENRDVMDQEIRRLLKEFDNLGLVEPVSE